MTSTTAPASFNAPFAPPRRLTGAGLIALGVGLNIPFAILGATFDYPDILRQPTAEVLQRFHAGGPPLIATWYAFLAAAIGFIPIAVLVHDSLAPGDGRRAPTALRLATVAGVGAGLVQALGLIRWVFAVPVLARTFNDPAATEAARASALVAFEGLHQYAGVALGEHLGQLGTAVWVLLISATLRSHAEFPRWQAWLGLASGVLILAGLVEGFATVISFNPGVLGLATPVGYVGFSVWMIAAGVSFLRRPSAAKRD